MRNKKEDSNNHWSEEQNYDFIKETIKKDDPEKWKGILKKAASIAGAGILFGTCAAGIFAYSFPAFSRFFYGESQDSVIRISQDIAEEKKDSGYSGKIAQEEPEKIKNSTVSYLEQITDELQDISEKARSSLVTVDGNSGNLNVLDHSYLGAWQAYGVIFAMDEDWIFMITEREAIEKEKGIQVTFADGTSARAELMGWEDQMGFAILAARMEDLPDEAKDRLTCVDLGNSYTLRKGQHVIAIGCPYGYPDSVAMGMITSMSTKVSISDGEYDLLVTDIPGASQGSGILLNLDGQVIGMMAQELKNYGKTADVVKALPISQMKPWIETLANGGKVCYVGIHGQELTEDLKESWKLLQGVYVDSVEENSPAMKAGIRSGDIIQEINGQEITSMETYSECVQSFQPGERIEILLKRKGISDYTEVKLYVTVEVKE